MEDLEGNLWIASGSGAPIYRKGSFERAFDNALMEGRRVWAFSQASDGVVCAAGGNGLDALGEGERYHQDLHGGRWGLPSNGSSSLGFDKGGTLWIGTTGGGLVSFVAGQFMVLNSANGFPHLENRRWSPHWLPMPTRTSVD